VVSSRGISTPCIYACTVVSLEGVDCVSPSENSAHPHSKQIKSTGEVEMVGFVKFSKPGK